MFVTALRRRFHGRRLVRGVLVVSAGNVLGTVVLFAATPAITRLYTPSDFGILGIYTSLLAILGVLSTLRYEGAIALPEQHDVSVNVLALCVALSLGSAAAVALLLGFSAQINSLFPTAAAVAPYRLLFVVNLAAFGIHQAFMFWAVRHAAFGQLAWLRVINCIAGVAVQIGLGLLAAGAMGLLMGSLLGFGCASIFLLCTVFKNTSILRGLSLSGLRGAAVRYRQFAVYSTGATILSRINVQLTPLIFAACYSLEAAGWYALAQRVVANPLTVLVNPVTRVYGSETARMRREGVAGLDVFFLRTLRRVLLFAVLPTAAGIVLLPWVFVFVFGSAWREAGIYCWILAPMVLMQMIADAVSPTLEVLEKQRTSLLLTGICVGLTLLSIAAAWLLAASPRGMLTGLSLASAVGNVLTIWSSWRHVCKAELSIRRLYVPLSLAHAA